MVAAWAQHGTFTGRLEETEPEAGRSDTDPAPPTPDTRAPSEEQAIHQPPTLKPKGTDRASLSHL